MQKLTDYEFELFKKLLLDFCGINIEESKKTLLINKLNKRIKDLGLSSYKKYYDLLKSDKKELLHFVDIIAIKETYFFRIPYHFEFLKKIAIPSLLKSNSIIRIWSAGCSTGEEPYSIAIVINEEFGMLKHKFELLATDISQSAIEKARKGEYNEKSVRHVPAQILKKYFLKEDDKYLLKEEIKKMVKFYIHNLLEPMHFTIFDIIFCRNVLIYFDDGLREKVIQLLFSKLAQGGYLFLGTCETLLPVRIPLKSLRHSIFQK